MKKQHLATTLSALPAGILLFAAALPTQATAGIAETETRLEASAAALPAPTRVGDIEYRISAIETSKSVKGGLKDITPESGNILLVIKGKIKNHGEKEVGTAIGSFYLIDDDGEQFELHKSSLWIDDSIKSINIASKAMKSYIAVFEVPADKSKFEFEVSNLELFGKKTARIKISK